LKEVRTIWGKALAAVRGAVRQGYFGCKTGGKGMIRADIIIPSAIIVMKVKIRSTEYRSCKCTTHKVHLHGGNEGWARS
jgi:hypothetical protein